MGYLFVAIAILCGVTKGYCGKKTSGVLVNQSDAMLVSTVRMIMCIVVGLVIIAFQQDFASLAAGKDLLFIAALSGVSTSVMMVCWLLSVKVGAYMMVDVFTLAGVIIPIILCRVLFEEKIHLIQWIGIALLLVASYIICTYNNSIKGKMTPKAFFLLVLCSVSTSIMDFSQKLFVRTVEGGSIATFNMYTYAFSALLLFVCFVFWRKHEKKTVQLQAPEKIILPIIVYIVIMAICLFLNSYFKTLAGRYLDAAQIYPLSQGSSVVLSMFMSGLLFHEKITARCIVGVAISFVALLFINVLPAYL